jgi:hypothetical protein
MSHQIHNPANVPEDKKKRGCRFLDTDEVGVQYHTEIGLLFMWYNLTNPGYWDKGGNFGTDHRATYCTPHSRAELRALRGLPPEEPAVPPAESAEVIALKARIAELEAQHGIDEMDYLDRAALAALHAVFQEFKDKGSYLDLARWSYYQARAMLHERRRVREEMRKEGAR